MIAARNLSHDYGTGWVLREIDLEVPAGEVLAIMGASGGGKSTLMRCLAGLLKPSNGEVLINDQSLYAALEQQQAKLGLVFQNAALFDSLNVYENVAFGVRRAKRLSRSELSELVLLRLKQVGLAEAENLMPSELSGGMRKRVGLARALALEPEILLYDEPTSGLDPVTAYAIDQLILDTRDRTGATSIVVSHDVSSVFRLADRIAFLAGGRLEYIGDPSGFRESPVKEIQELLTKASAEKLGKISTVD